MLGVAIVVSLVFTAFAANSASATQNWYACEEVGPNFGFQLYKDSDCTIKSETGPYGWVKLTELTGFQLSNTGSLTVKVPMWGVSVVMSCPTMSLEGTVENHATGNGTFAQIGSSLKLAGCTVSTPSGCTVGTLGFAPLKGEATEFEGEPVVKFSPTEGTGLFEFTLSNCGIFNGTKLVTGYLEGVVSNNWETPSSLEFTSASSRILYSGKLGSFEGTGKMEAKVGEESYPLMVLPY